jgi:hypothetical protein
VRKFIEVDHLHENIHGFSEFNRIPVIFRQVFFQEKVSMAG